MMHGFGYAGACCLLWGAAWAAAWKIAKRKLSAPYGLRLLAISGFGASAMAIALAIILPLEPYACF